VLLRFGIRNHTSFREPTELSFVANSQADAPTWRMTARDAPHGVLPALGVWGANASGKSNLLRAVLAFRKYVKDSFTGLERDAPLPWSPFALRTGEADPPTHMDVDLILAGQRYHYGFRFTSRGVVEEWLYAWPRHRRQVLFHRDHTQADPWHFGANLGGQRQVIARVTRPNSLFLSAAAQHDHEQLVAVYRAITDAIVAERRVELYGHPLFKADSPILDPALRPLVTKFLAAADLGVLDIRAEEVPVVAEGPGEGAAGLSSEALRGVSEIVARAQPFYKVHLRHGLAGSESWELVPEMESRGTQILLRRLEDMLRVLRGGGLLVLDEIDTSLHPDLCGALIELFTTESANPRGAQLLFATHNEDLLKYLRRDEIVLVNKDVEGASTIRTASQYPDLRGRDDVGRAYAQGRIRGVPALGNLVRITAQGLHHGA